jgi:hypothetical protein
MGNDMPLPDRKYFRSIICCSIIGVVTFLAFLPSINNDFTNWDDDAYVTDNPDIKGFTAGNIAKVFSSTYVSNYQPVTMLTYMIEHSFFKLNPSVYHTTNMILHIINAFLIFVLFRAISRHHVTALLVGLLFAIHPMRVESVAWIAERKDVLYAFFFLLSLLFYVKYMNKNKRGFYWLCAISLLLSLLSKPMAVSQPFVLLLIDYISKRKLNKEAVLSKIPFFAIIALFAVLTFSTQRSTGAISEFPQISLIQRICVPFYGTIFYPVKSLLPVNLCAFYPYPAVHDGSESILLFFSPFLIICLAMLIYYFRDRSRTVIFGSLFYLITLLPVLQIIPVGGAMVAERNSYIPMLGMYFIFGAWIRYLLEVKFVNSFKIKSIVVVGLSISLFLFGWLTYKRVGMTR